MPPSPPPSLNALSLIFQQCSISSQRRQLPTSNIKRRVRGPQLNLQVMSPALTVAVFVHKQPQYPYMEDNFAELAIDILAEDG